MQPEGLKEYIVQCRSQGLADEQIKAALRQAGWTDEQFVGEFPPVLPPAESAESATLPTAEASSADEFFEPERKRRSPLLGAIAFFLLTAGGAWWLYIASQQQLPIFLPITISVLAFLLAAGLAYPAFSKSEK